MGQRVGGTDSFPMNLFRGDQPVSGGVGQAIQLYMVTEFVGGGDHHCRDTAVNPFQTFRGKV